MKLFRRIFGWIYTTIMKPLLFRLSPDTAHAALITVAKVWQRIPGLRQLTRWLLAPREETLLKQELFGVTFHNPVGISAGFDKNGEVQPTLDMIGCGFATSGSVTLHPRAGNPRPWFYRLPRTKSLVVHAGLANEGLERVITKNIQQTQQVQERMPLVLSVAIVPSSETCTIQQAIAEACETMRFIEQQQLSQLIEVNISCPNAQDGQPFTQPDHLEALLQAVDELQLTLPVFVKMPNKPTWNEFEPLIACVAQHDVQGVTISNLVKDRETVDLQDELPEAVKGGLSGKPTWERSNALIRETYKRYGDTLVIIGVGGIFSADNAYEKIQNGASLVALITGMIFEGPQLIGDITTGLTNHLKRDGFSSLSEAVGSAVQDNIKKAEKSS